MKKFIFVLFFITCIFQLSMLSFRVYEYENILKNGKTFYFLPAPIDPRDLFRGRYVTLSFKNQEIITKKDFKQIKRGDFIYVTLKSSNNQTKIENVFTQKPKNGDFLKVKYIMTGTKNRVIFRFLFNRYYMNEHKSKKAEKLYNKLTNKDKLLAKVKVLNGVGVIENIYINSIPLNKYIEY